VPPREKEDPCITIKRRISSMGGMGLLGIRSPVLWVLGLLRSIWVILGVRLLVLVMELVIKGRYLRG